MSLSGHLAGNWKITISTDRELDRTLLEDAMPRMLQPIVKDCGSAAFIARRSGRRGSRRSGDRASGCIRARNVIFSRCGEQNRDEGSQNYLRVADGSPVERFLVICVEALRRLT